MQFLKPLKTLGEPLFRRLYIAQGISLLGDSITWVGIALLAVAGALAVIWGSRQIFFVDAFTFLIS